MNIFEVLKNRNNMVYKEPDIYEKSLFSIIFYDNICFIQKYERSGLSSYRKLQLFNYISQIPMDKNYE